MGLGISLRALMNARKQNVAQIAAASGMDAQKVYYILKHDPISGDMSALKRLADAYGITLEYFVNPDLEAAAREAQLRHIVWDTRNASSSLLHRCQS